MNFGTDQLPSTYVATTGITVVVGPSSWLGEMGIGGVVPPPDTSAGLFDYSF